MEYARRRLDLERARFAIGTVALIDTLSASLQMAQAQQALFGDSLLLLKARNQLALTLMSRPDSLALVDSVAFELNSLPAAEQLLAQVQHYNPDRQIFELTAQRLQLQQERAKNQLLPDLRANVSVALDDDTEQWSLYNRSVVSLLVSYSLPVRKKRNLLAEIKLEEQKNSYGTQLNDQQLRVAVEELVTTWDQERQRLDLAKTSQNIANQHFIAAQRGYELGTVDYLRYIEAENSLRDASLQLLSQQIGLKRLEITFDELSGNLFARFGVTF
jgi:outer membrane protein TolC